MQAFFCRAVLLNLASQRDLALEVDPPEGQQSRDERDPQIHLHSWPRVAQQQGDFNRLREKRPVHRSDALEPQELAND